MTAESGLLTQLHEARAAADTLARETQPLREQIAAVRALARAWASDPATAPHGDALLQIVGNE